MTAKQNELAYAAWCYVADTKSSALELLRHDVDAEAEALIRTGWTPD